LHLSASSQGNARDPDRSFFGHPRGLQFIAFTEAWERFSYYGMQTLLVLYMTRQALRPGHIERIAAFLPFRHGMEWLQGRPLDTVAMASAIFGLYTSLVYLTPIGGGWLADRWLGRTRTITLGAVLMAAGHFLMAFEQSLLFALLCLLIGVGCFKGNLASQVGNLYSAEDLRRADAYQIYYLFINGAVIVSPLVTGTLGEKVGWEYGFGAAGVGMLISLAIYLSGRKYLPPDIKVDRGKQSRPPPLTTPERKATLILIFLIPVLAIGAVGNQEIFDAYMLWVPDHIDMTFFGWTIPTTWLVTLDAVVSVSFLAGSILFWRLWAKRYREPQEIAKLAIGAAACTAALLSLTAAAAVSTAGQKASFGWILLFEVLNSFGFSNVFPVGMALFARASPPRLVGLMMGVYLLHLSLCNYLVGWLGGLVERLPGTQFWLLHAGLVGTSCAILFILSRTATGVLSGTSTSPATQS
jgi:POT family proton-dependent oligopeptide transporter